MKTPHSPPFQITPKVLKLVSKISTILGRWDGASQPKPKLALRKSNKIKTIQSSLAIEGNTLTIEQVTDLLDQKRVLGPKKDILEVKNALIAYDLIPRLNAHSEKDFLKLHQVLMKDLVTSNGKYRSTQVGVLKGSKVSHVAPPAKQVPLLMSKLFNFIQNSDLDALIISSIVHYEIEFIHPFIDGNGRMGRLWQSLILRETHPLFEFVPIESAIKARQNEYYDSLERSDKAGESTPFLEYILSILASSLNDLIHPKNFETVSPSSRLLVAKEHFASRTFSRADYMQVVGQISTATASRDLAEAVKNKSLIKMGEQRLARYRFI